MAKVLRRSRRGALRRHIGLKYISTTPSHNLENPTYLAQPTVNNKVRAIDKAALVAGQEDHRVSLLNGLAESAAGEVHLTTEALGMVVA